MLLLEINSLQNYYVQKVKVTNEEDKIGYNMNNFKIPKKVLRT